MDDHYVQLWLVSNFVENNTFTIALARSSKNVLLAALISIHNTSIEGGKQMQGVESRQERRAALGQFKSLPTSCERRRRQRITALLLLDAGRWNERAAASKLAAHQRQPLLALCKQSKCRPAKGGRRRCLAAPGVHGVRLCGSPSARSLFSALSGRVH